ncbi:MAG: TolC family protein, partial [Muribaculaceae bacterium]|nr:TolC family protein [Muribaculaceae bacterium]
MRRFCISALIALMTTAAFSAESVTLSREECIDIALSTSPTVKVADMEVKRMEYAKRESQSGLYPTIDFQAAYQRSIELQTIRMDMGGQSQNLKMGSDNTWNMGFTASLPIIAPQLWKSINISQTQILSAMEAARASRLELVNQVNKAYYSLLLAVASREVVQQNYDIAKFNADLFEKQFAAGTASEYDVLRSSVQVKNIEPELLQADIAVRQCKLQLVVLMGVDYNLDIEPSVTLKDMQRDMYGYALGADTGLSNNSSLRSLDLNARMLDETVSLRKRAWIPTVGASYNMNWLSLSNGSPFKNQSFNPYSNVSLAVNIPIFSGGSKYYALKQAQAQRLELDLQRENLINGLQMQVDLALDNINREVMQISSSEENVQQAEKAYTIMQKSFEIGAATYLNLRDSELAKTSAQLAYYQSIYN